MSPGQSLDEEWTHDIVGPFRVKPRTLMVEDGNVLSRSELE